MKVIICKLVVGASKLLLGSTESVHKGGDGIIWWIVFFTVEGHLNVVDEDLVVLIAVFGFKVIPELLGVLVIHKGHQGGSDAFRHRVINDLEGSVAVQFPVLPIWC